MSQMKFSLFFFFTIISFTIQQTLAQVKMAVAANAQYVMKDILNAYEKETGKKIEMVSGSSGKLAAQIREGAPFDIFLSADMEFPETLFKEGLSQEQARIYAYGTLVLWTNKQTPKLNINWLKSDEIKHIAIANPKLAPYGEAAIQCLSFFKLYESVKDKLVYGESIAQVNQYLTTGNTETGFTAKSTVLHSGQPVKGQWIEIDRRAYSPIAQGVLLLKRNPESQSFYNFLFGKKARNLFLKYGYQLPE